MRSHIVTRVFVTLLLLSSALRPARGDTPEKIPICEQPKYVNKGIPPDQLKWRKLDGGNQEQHLFLVAFMDQGFEIIGTIFTFKYGPWQRWGLYAFLHEDTTGKTWGTRKECPSEILKVSDTNLDVACGGTSFSGTWPDYKFVVDEPEFNAELDIHVSAPSFEVGECNYSTEKKIFTNCYIFAPRGRLKGAVTVEGVTREVRGEVYGDQARVNVPFTKVGPSFYAVRVFPDSSAVPDEKLYLNFSSAALHKSYGDGYDLFTFIVRGDKIAAISRDLEIKPLEQVVDKETGYKYVKRAGIKSQGENFHLDAQFTVEETIEIMDIFKLLPDWIRKIAEKFWKRPVYFRFLGTFEGELELDGKKMPVKQRATAEMNFTQ